MKKNKVLPYNKDAKAFKGSERAQSDSSLEMFANCPAYFAYGYGLFAHRGKPEKFVWFIYGSIIHQVADAIRTEVLIEKKVSPHLEGEALGRYLRKWYFQVKLALDPEFAYEQKGECEPFIWVPRETINKMGDKRYQELADKKRKTYLDKAWNTIKAVYLSCRVPTTFTYNKYEWRFSSQKFRAPNLHRPGESIWLLGAFDEVNYMESTDGRWYTITDLKSGSKNNLKLENNHQMLMYNYISRNIDHASPSKKDGQRLEHLGPFNGQPPKEQYLVSLDVEGWAIAKHGELTLYSDDFRLMVEVNYDVEWPEHHAFISDVSTVQHYLLKEYDQNGNLFTPEFEPLSTRGKQIDVGRSLREQRFVPRIGPRCGLCPAKQWCQQDHPDDWDHYRDRHDLGLMDDDHFIVQPEDDAVEVENGASLLPDKTYQPRYIPVQAVLDFTGLGGSKHNLFISKTVPKRKLKEMQDLGFMQAKSLLANLKKFWQQLPFLEGGRKCQCMGFKHLMLLPIFLVFLKYVNGKWSLVFDSKVLHEFMLVHCPLEDCLRRAEHLAKDGELKRAIGKHREGIILPE